VVGTDDTDFSLTSPAYGSGVHAAQRERTDLRY
jgi:hypothetical protein